VVQVEVSIDEKGNVVETKAVSGPRLLQASAQRAVGIWIFEPAFSDGKPIASHMVVTVEFQKTPEGTN
jgi:outer membrane biosynthesis protein TonB